jgi:hypothetical protein
MAAAIFARLFRFMRHLAARASYEAALTVVAKRAKVPVRKLRRRYVPASAFAPKRRAVYLTVMHGHSRRDVARAAGLSHEQVARYCQMTEEERDDARLDRILDELELELMP